MLRYSWRGAFDAQSEYEALTTLTGSLKDVEKQQRRRKKLVRGTAAAAGELEQQADTVKYITRELCKWARDMDARRFRHHVAL